MKLTNRPALPPYLHESFTNSKPIQDAIVARIAALEAKKTPPGPEKFTRQKQVFIRAMAGKRLGTAALQRLYIKELDELRQVCSRPKITDLEFDTYAALDQPEILDAFAQWEYPRGGRGFTANPTCTKALLTLMALGEHTHFKRVRQKFVAASGMQRVFAAIEEKVAAIAGRDAQPCTTREYTVCLDHAKTLCSTGISEVLLGSNIEMMKAFCDLYPDEEVCVYAAVDGTKDPAWVKQVGVGETEEEELAIRERTPKAGARYIQRDNETVVINDDDGQEIVVTGIGEFWRGYYLVALVCLKTGLPIIWTLRDANPMYEKSKETEATRELFEHLYELWPDCPLQFVVADKAWDWEEHHRFCLTQYGVHLVSIQRDDHRDGKPRVVDQVDHKNIVEYNGRGEVWCRHHHNKSLYEPLALVGYEFPSRDGLAPGDIADLTKFRVRYRCEHCARTYSLPQRGTGKNRDWHFFTFLPRSPLHPKRFARRRALETHRNTIESVFASLKTVSQLAIDGASRTRLTDFDTVATLVALSFTLRNAQVLAAERIRIGQYPSAFPADLLNGREMFTA